MCAIEESSSFKGPLPPPEVLKGYESILPGAFERILTMAEKQQKHRMDIERKIVYSQTNQSRLGQMIGAMLAIFFGMITFLLGYWGHEWLAGALGTGTIVALATLLFCIKFLNRLIEEKENLQKRRMTKTKCVITPVYSTHLSCSPLT